MSNPTYNSTNFVNNLPTFTYQVDTSTTGTFPAAIVGSPEYQGLLTEWQTRTQINGAAQPAVTATGSALTTQFQTEINQLYAAWDASNTDPSKRLVFPRNWSDFITQFRAYFGIPNNAGLGINSSNPNSGPAFTGFFTTWRNTLKTDTDWSTIPAATISSEFVASFSGFLNNYPFTKSESPPNSGNFVYKAETLDVFIDNWRQFDTVTTVNTAATITDPANQPAYQGLLTYEQTYKAFFPNATSAEFNQALQSFISEVNTDQKNGGYFIPSQFFDRFFQEIKSKYLVFQATQGTLQANSGSKLSILMEVLKLVIEMITTIQNTTAITAQRLGYLTNFQQSYTQLIGSIPTFLNGQPYNAETTGPINSKMQAFAQNLQSYRDLLGSDSKTLQSNVNALNESANTQANLATDILQELTSLMTTITKGG